MASSRSLRIAICGTRGVPARYGGFETFAEQLGERLVKKGHTVLVYGRSYRGEDDHNSTLSEYKGMELRTLPAIRHKYFETPLHTFVSFVDLYRVKVDVVLLCNAANSLFAWMPLLKRTPVIINVDGIERARRKWNTLGRAWYLLGEHSSALFGTRLVSDANYIRKYYLDSYGADSSVIRYGARIMGMDDARRKAENDFSFMKVEEVQYLQGLNLVAGEYLLYVSRLEPENNADKVISAYAMLPLDLREKYPLVIVGDAPYSDTYKKSLHAEASSEVKFLGYRFGHEYETLQRGAAIYFQATEVGGTHPALVEAMGFANCILANDVPEHREVVESVSLIYQKNDPIDLSECTLRLLENPSRIKSLRDKAYQRAMFDYSWDAVCQQYEDLFSEVT
jgi:glycosyltransferase involved in cell wall biosynthesis